MPLSISTGPVDKVLRDNISLDLVGALDDLHHLRIAEVAVDRVVVGDTGRPKQLDSVGDFHGHVACERFGNCGGLGEFLPRTPASVIAAAL